MPRPPEHRPAVSRTRVVLLANRQVVFDGPRRFPSAPSTLQSPTVRGGIPYVLATDLAIDRDLRIRAVADGARVVRNLPNNALLVEADAAALKNLATDEAFAGAVEYEPSDKMPAGLARRAQPGDAFAVEPLFETDLDAIAEAVAAAGGTVVSRTEGRRACLVVKPGPKGLVKLARRGDVRWIRKEIIE